MRIRQISIRLAYSRRKPGFRVALLTAATVMVDPEGISEPQVHFMPDVLPVAQPVLQKRYFITGQQ